MKTLQNLCQIQTNSATFSRNLPCIVHISLQGSGYRSLRSLSLRSLTGRRKLDLDGRIDRVPLLYSLVAKLKAQRRSPLVHGHQPSRHACSYRAAHWAKEGISCRSKEPQLLTDFVCTYDLYLHKLISLVGDLFR